jgi:DNA polymerase, archaea type
VSTEVRLTKTPEQYLSTRERRRELPYEALLGSGRSSWSTGERIRVYRALGGRAALLAADPRDEENVELATTSADARVDRRDYDVDYYARLLRETFAARFVRALEPEVFQAVFADPAQLSLFSPALEQARPVLTVLFDPRGSPARATP